MFSSCIGALFSTFLLFSLLFSASFVWQSVRGCKLVMSLGTMYVGLRDSMSRSISRTGSVEVEAFPLAMVPMIMGVDSQGSMPCAGAIQKPVICSAKRRYRLRDIYVLSSACLDRLCATFRLTIVRSAIHSTYRIQAFSVLISPEDHASWQVPHRPVLTLLIHSDLLDGHPDPRIPMKSISYLGNTIPQRPS